MRYIDNTPKEWKRKQKLLFYEIERKREMFYDKYRHKVKRIF